MKQIFALISAGIIGGLIVLGGVILLSDGTSPEPPNSIPVQPVRHLNVAPDAANAPFDFSAAARRARPAVVHITARSTEDQAKLEKTPEEDNPFRFFFGDEFPDSFGDNGPRQGSGSGVIYSPDGYIITNNHVVEFADEVEVTLSDNRKFSAEIVGTFEQSDLAVLKIEATGLPTITIADSDRAQIGEWVLAVGNPFDLTSTVTAGIISAKGRSIRLLGGGKAIESFIQTDAVVNPGNSGGALVDADGNLLGINTAIATRTGVYQGYAFAIPSKLVTRIVDDIIEYGSYRRPFLGVSIRELNNDYANTLGLNITQGVVVEDLIDGGSAQYAGVRPKDVIVGVDGEKITGVPQLQALIGQAQVGDEVVLTINRQGEKIRVPVRLQAG